MLNLKIDDLEFNTEDFDDIETKILSDIQLCDAKLSLLREELRLFEIRAQPIAQISTVIKDKNPKGATIDPSTGRTNFTRKDMSLPCRPTQFQRVVYQQVVGHYIAVVSNNCNHGCTLVINEVIPKRAGDHD